MLTQYSFAEDAAILLLEVVTAIAHKENSMENN